MEQEKIEQEKEEKNMLIRLCKEFNIPYSPNTKIENLEQKVVEYFNGIKKENINSIVKTNTKKYDNKNILTNVDKIKQQLKLVYCRITCNNPDKQNIDGEVFTVANKHHTITKTIFFRTNYWAPDILLNSIKEKFYTRGVLKKNKDGKEVLHIEKLPEYSIEYLPIPDDSYFEALKQKQLALKAQQNYEDFNTGL